MNTALWIAQGILAGLFGMAGLMKSSQPKEKLEKNMSWVSRASTAKLRFVGISELLGAVGLIVPWLTGILPLLTPAAASALSLVMVLAAVDHLRNKEPKAVIFNFVLFALSAFVAYGRFTG